VRWSWTQRVKWTPVTNIVRSGELEFDLITDYCYHNWALQASGDIAFYTHLHPVRLRTPLSINLSLLLL
jgi:hypothetical protein